MEATHTRRQSAKIFFQFLSWVFHPVFIPVMGVGFLLFSDTSTAFLGFREAQRWLILGQAFTLYTFFPLVTVGLLKAVGFLDSVHLRTQRERVIPLIATGIWYFWIWYVWKNLPDYPAELVRLALATWTASWVTLMINVRMKISLHTIAAGLMLTFLCLWSINHPYGAGIYLPIASLLAGAIGAARLEVSDHTQTEVYGGYALGIITMLTIHLLYR
jgi:hypothetical protein